MEVGQPSQSDRVKCVRCCQDLPASSFDPDKLQRWRSGHYLARDATCKACLATPAEVDCVICGVKLHSSAFDTHSLSTWTRNRDISKRAKCMACVAKEPTRRSTPKQTWKQIAYTCSICETAFPASKFDTRKLKQWEESAMLYLARCGSCDSDSERNAQAMKCNLCGLTKPGHAFSATRQRSRDYSTRRCKECDFPKCSSCGTIPTLPKQKPYTCLLCQFPPCGCGARRPPYSQNRVSVNPTWQCPECRR